MKLSSKGEAYQKLPSVDELLRQEEVARLVPVDGHAAVTNAARTALSRLREEISRGNLDAHAVEIAVGGLPIAIERALRESTSYSLRPVINAAGVILHTNLGRAPLAESVLYHIQRTAASYSNLEFDVSTGERGKRDVHVERLFRKLLGEEGGQPISTIVVNNNAAAVLLALNTLAEGGEVIVSRGELVEIGGSFRIPDVMGKSNAVLREVGTTNRTRIADYERAINERTKLLLRVHRSNFEISGFTEQPSLDELAQLGRKRNIPVMEDLGSGALFDLELAGVRGEPGVLDSLRTGVDVITYSGDKLLGGPQAGMLSGRSDLISRMRSNSLFRALRVDKLIYAALEATLLAYVKQDHSAIPALRMMRLSKEEIELRAGAITQKLKSSALTVELVDGDSVIGGGAAPSATLPTRLLALSHWEFSVDQLAAQLRSFDPPIVARVEHGRVLIDLRTVFPEQDEQIINTLSHLAG